ncbi:MAG TPA: flavin reductase family protein [Gemmatimonadales bacterium]|nr:flavin reductase family protein [Gemmatimonadales bacterium]
MLTDAGYELLRQLASPVVAITTTCDGRTNGMIMDSAVRASISPAHPRLLVVIHKWHLTHEFIRRTGRFALHLLHRGQLELVYRLGFRSGRDCGYRKLDGIAWHPGRSGLPLLADCLAAFECRVANAMDGGASTIFLADVEHTMQGPGGDLLTAQYFREHMPAAWRPEWERNYREAQERIARMAEIRTDVRWEPPAGSG